MWGAIIGDLAGSIYEFDQMKKISNVDVTSLITDKSFYSDDSLLTVAVLDAILNDLDYEKYLRMYGKEYLEYMPDFTPYFKTTFSPGFIKWINSNEQGNSFGNGAMMRVSPVGYLFNTEEDVINNARLATIPSHNTFEAINSATIVSLIIFYSRCGLSKQKILEKLDIKVQYKSFDKFNYTCQDTLNNCLYALFTSNSFEESVRTVISYGGDTDTNACIVGSMAEAMYGIEENLIDQAKKKIPKQFIKKLELAYRKMA